LTGHLRLIPRPSSMFNYEQPQGITTWTQST
jgi:hypothetical protein